MKTKSPRLFTFQANSGNGLESVLSLPICLTGVVRIVGSRRNRGQIPSPIPNVSKFSRRQSSVG